MAYAVGYRIVYKYGADTYQPWEYERFERREDAEAAREEMKKDGLIVTEVIYEPCD